MGLHLDEAMAQIIDMFSGKGLFGEISTLPSFVMIVFIIENAFWAVYYVVVMFLYLPVARNLWLVETLGGISNETNTSLANEGFEASDLSSGGKLQYILPEEAQPYVNVSGYSFDENAGETSVDYLYTIFSIVVGIFGSIGAIINIPKTLGLICKKTNEGSGGSLKFQMPKVILGSTVN